MCRVSDVLLVGMLVHMGQLVGCECPKMKSLFFSLSFSPTPPSPSFFFFFLRQSCIVQADFKLSMYEYEKMIWDLSGFYRFLLPCLVFVVLAIESGALCMLGTLQTELHPQT